MGRSALAFLLLGATPQACAPVRSYSGSELTDSSSTSPAALDRKLGEQWHLYDAARTLLIDRVVDKQSLVSRSEWETALSLPVADQLTPSDIAALKLRQDKLADAAQRFDESVSVLSLDKVRAAGPAKVTEFCAELPKGGMLHIHPWGTLDRPTAQDILRAVNPPVDFDYLLKALSTPSDQGILYSGELATLKDMAGRYSNNTKYLDLATADQAKLIDFFFLPAGAHGFDRFLGSFTVISKLVFANKSVDPEPLMEAAFFARAQREHVRYVEISRFILPRSDWVKSLDAWASDKQTKYGITARYLAAFARNKSPDYTRSKTEQLLKLPASKILVGVNLLNDESAYPALEQGQTLYAPLLSEVEKHRSELHRTIHAGELGDVRNVRDAMIFGAERIGHGVRLIQDPVALEYARLRQLPVETNLVSNVRLQVVDDVKNHPFLYYLRLGLLVSISTDDEGVFQSDIDSECEMAVNNTDVNYAELKAMSENAIKTGFAESDVKDGLLKDLAGDFQNFETHWAAFK